MIGDISLPDALASFIDEESKDFMIQTNYSISRKESRGFIVTAVIVIIVISSICIPVLLTTTQDSNLLTLWMFFTIFCLIGIAGLGYGISCLLPRMYYFIGTPSRLIRYSHNKIWSLNREELINIKESIQEKKMNIISLEIKNNKAPEAGNKSTASVEFISIISESDLTNIAHICRQRIYRKA